MRVLVTWEIGQGYGHVLPLLDAARALRAAGHEVTFALADLRQASAPLRAEGFAVLQAPLLPGLPVPPGAPQPETLSHILALHGFDRQPLAEAALHAWRTLMQLARAELVVASYAPMSLLAARSLGLATRLVGLSFELPPRRTPSPSFRPWLKTPPERLQAADDAVVSALDGALRPLGLSLQGVHDIFTADRRILTTFRELDVYGDRADTDPDLLYFGGLQAPAVGPQAEWPGGSRPRLFGYLYAGMPGLDALLHALRALPVQACLAIRGLRPADERALQGPHLRVQPSPVQLGTALSACHAVLNHGGHGTVCASLLAGRPMVLLPQEMEPSMTSQCVERLGAARVPRDRQAAAVAEACLAACTDPALAGAARAFAQRHAGQAGLGAQEQGQRLAHALLEQPPAPAGGPLTLRKPTAPGPATVRTLQPERPPHARPE